MQKEIREIRAPVGGATCEGVAAFPSLTRNRIVGNADLAAGDDGVIREMARPSAKSEAAAPG